jgi:DNA invertase Pin-like site-specific DNA recombinase
MSTRQSGGPAPVITTVENQRIALEAVCEQRGWQVMQVYSDNGVSGAKSRNQRPGLDAMLKDAGRGRFDVVLAWALDRLGRSLIDLLDTLGELDAASVALVLHQQAIDTTTPAGRMFFQVTGAFAEFERGMIRSRVIAGLAGRDWRISDAVRRAEFCPTGPHAASDRRTQSNAKRLRSVGRNAEALNFVVLMPYRCRLCGQQR